VSNVQHGDATQGTSGEYDGPVIEVESMDYDDSSSGLVRESSLNADFRAHGRFAVALNVGGVTSTTRVVAAATELTGGPGTPVPFLGSADLRIYNVVATPGRVTARGEAFWDSDINIRVMFIISG
jgi:hypothetical protein